MSKLNSDPTLKHLTKMKTEVKGYSVAYNHQYS